MVEVEIGTIRAAWWDMWEAVRWIHGLVLDERSAQGLPLLSTSATFIRSASAQIYHHFRPIIRLIPPSSSRISSRRVAFTST